MNEPDNDANYPQRVEHVYTFHIPAKQNPERIDAFIARSIEHATRTRVQRAIDMGAVTVNDRPVKSNYKIRPNDTILVTVLKPPPLQLIPQNIELDVLYEDADILVINKPAGIAVHPGVGNRVGTIVNAVMWHMGMREAVDIQPDVDEWTDDQSEDETVDDEGDDDDSLVVEDVPVQQTDELAAPDHQALNSDAIRPGIVHRLDKDTSGVMVIGKTYESTLALSRQFASRTVSRQYVALAWGVIKEDVRVIEGEIGRSTRDRKLMQVVDRGGKYAATEVTVEERYNCATLVTCRLRTGRTHQIRVHLASLRHPLVGDEPYGGRETAFKGVHHLYRPQAREILLAISRQALHARSLAFDHPTTGQRMEFSTPVPADILAAIVAVRPTEVGPLPPCVLE